MIIGAVTLGTRLKELRGSRNLTQEQMADLLGIKRERYKSYESDRTEPEFSLLKHIANMFSRSIDWLLDNQPPTAPPALATDPTPIVEALRTQGWSQDQLDQLILAMQLISAAQTRKSSADSQ